MKNFMLLAFVAVILSGCSRTEYVAHVAKQIVLPQDAPSKSVGYFKVGSSYKIKGRRYYPTETYDMTEKGSASWYGPGFHGKMTANGEIFDENELTAAHRTLQLPSVVRVTNLDNGRSVILRVNDRGPFAHDRILDVSKRGATVLGFKDKGVANIRLEVMSDQSREVATISKSGKSTRGYEVAYNNGQQSVHGDLTPVPPAKPIQLASSQIIEPVTQIAFDPAVDPIIEPSVYQDPNPYNNTDTNTQTASTAQVPNVQATPLNGVLQNAVAPAAQNSSKLFVQAASFSQEANALSLSNRLSSLGRSQVYMTQVNNTPYYRVRLGPYDNAAQAEQVISSLAQAGNQSAVIVTE